MAGIAEVGAKKVKQPEVQGKDITIYFGVFFDGTNNHRLQVMIGKLYREKHGFTNTFSDDERQFIKDFTLDVDYKKDEKGIDSKQQELTNKEDELKSELSSLKTRLENRDIYDKDYYLLKDRIDIVEEELKGIQIEKSFDLSDHTLDELFQYDKENKKQQDVQTNGFTNIALLEPFYQAKESLNENEYAYRIYVTGSGTNRDIEKGDNNWGLGFGQGDTGVGQKVIDAFNAVRSKLALVHDAKSIKLEFCVFGFSRGATEARNFVYNLSKANDKKNLPKVLNNDKVKEYKVPFLGLYDTVASVGILEKLDSKQIRDTTINIGGASVDSGIMIGAEVLDFGLDAFHEVKGWLLKTFKHRSDSGWEYKIKDHSATHQHNVQDLGLYATTESYQVGKVLHICAADEYRENFALVDIKSSRGSNGVEMFIPGAHADVGGGYNDADTVIKLETVPYYISPINKSLKIQGEFLYNSSEEKNESTAVDSLRKLGWIDDGSNTDYNHKHKRSIIESDDRVEKFYSGAIIGYSYIGLHLMEKYANKHGGNVIFKVVDPHFSVPKDLEKWYENKLKRELLNKERGIISIEDTQPKKEKDGIDYRKLRNKYLHFSSNYTRSKKFGVDAFHVNTPSLFDVGNAYEYRRIIYQGVSSEDARLLSQYANGITENNILYDLYKSGKLDDRLLIVFDVLRKYIEEANQKAKSTLQKNLSEKRENCTRDGYFQGEVKDVNNPDSVVWPDPYFEVGTMEIVIIPPGTEIDRYSNENGGFFGVAGTEIEYRCLPVVNAIHVECEYQKDDNHKYKSGKCDVYKYNPYGQYHKYVTKEPLIAIKSKVAPKGFGKRGGADQYQLPFNTTKKHVSLKDKWQLRPGKEREICPKCGERYFVPLLRADDWSVVDVKKYGRCDDELCGYFRSPERDDVDVNVNVNSSLLPKDDVVFDLARDLVENGCIEQSGFGPPKMNEIKHEEWGKEDFDD